jgi:glutamate-1-semialdehyde aminotransferase
MRLFEQVFFSGTFGGETASIAGGIATILELKKRDGIATIWRNGAALQQGTRRLLHEHGLSASVECAGLPPWTTIRIKGFSEEDTLALRSYFQQECVKRGVLTLGAHMLSVAHDESVIQELLTVYAGAVPLLAEAIRKGDARSRLEGPPVRSIIRS